MAIELEKHELRSFEIRKRKHKQKVTILAILITIIVLIISVFVIRLLLHKNYSGYKVVHTIKRSDSNSAKYVSYGSDILRYSRDGATAMDAEGNLLWDGSYEMNDPVVDICDKYVAISDRGYKSIEIFDGKGGKSTITVNNPIIKTEIANQGVVAVLMEGKEADYISIFDKDGETLVDSRTTEEKDGFPIDIDLSEDGKKLVSSYVSVNGEALKNKITFYNFDEVGQNYESRVVGGFDFGTTLVSNIEFINKNTVCAFGDNKFSIYGMEKTPELRFEKKISSDIKSIFYNEKYIGFVLSNTKDKNTNRVLVYDLNGKVKLDKTMSYQYKSVSISDNEIIFNSAEEWIIWRMDGSEKLNLKFDSNITSILPVKNLGRYIIINNKNIQEVKITQ